MSFKTIQYVVGAVAAVLFGLAVAAVVVGLSILIVGLLTAGALGLVGWLVIRRSSLGFQRAVNRRSHEAGDVEPTP